MCVVSLYLFPGVGPCLLWRDKQHWENMAGKNTRKNHHQPTEDTQEVGEGGEAEKSFLELARLRETRKTLKGLGKKE